MLSGMVQSGCTLNNRLLPVIFLFQNFMNHIPESFFFLGIFCLNGIESVLDKCVKEWLEFWHLNPMSVEVNKNFIKILGNGLDK